MDTDQNTQNEAELTVEQQVAPTNDWDAKMDLDEVEAAAKESLTSSDAPELENFTVVDNTQPSEEELVQPDDTQL